MPYRHGHYYVGFTLLVTLAGFWASYFTLKGAMPLAFHVHAITALAWLAFLVVQSVAIHRRHNALHKTLGQASFLLFPLLMVGFVAIINLSASRYVAAESEVIMVAGPSFGVGMLIALAAYLALFYNALKHRRNIRLHAGYMLATPMILFESPFSRVMDRFFPWMNVIGSEGPRAILDTIAISDALVAAFALVLYFRDRKNGAPWLMAAGFVLLQAVVMWFAPDMPFLNDAFGAYGRIPPTVTLAAGALAGIAVTYFGWVAGSRPKAKPVATTAG